MSKRTKLSFTTLTLIGLLLGTITGVLIHSFLADGFIKDTLLINGVFYVIGNGFIALMKMLVMPLIFASIITGTIAIGDTRRLGRIGGKTIAFYLSTTAFAIVIAIGVANFFDPGVGLDMSSLAVSEYTVSERVPFTEVILDMIPSNIFASLTNGDVIPVIVFAVLIGISITTLDQDRESVVAKFFVEFNDVMMSLTSLVMKAAPIGVFCLVAKTFATLGFEAIFSLLLYMVSVLVGLGVHLVVVYMGIFFIFTKKSPIQFFKKFSSVMMFAFSVSSSNATIPINIETLEENIGVSRKISSFTIPLGATINMDGTAIMQGVAVVFTAQAFGVQLTAYDYLLVIATATLASIGTAGVPGVGLVMLSMVLTAVGLPVEAIGIIMGVDRILDMTRTSINVAGDAICTTIIAKQEGEWNEEVFDN
ncbi:MAG: dicarboxylate/amino acid:cation symporter [Lachnospirales bacterium]